MSKFRKIMLTVVLSAMMCMMNLTAFAATDYTAATDALSSGFTEVAAQIVTVAGVAIAGGIGIFGLKKLVTAAMSFFSKIVK